MSEGIDLPFLERGRLLPERERLARLDQALPQIEAILAGETDAVALQSTLACALWETLAQTNFCGFYRRIGPSTLAVGPYQGSMGCLRIDFARGVCGAAARTRQVQLVEDVHQYPGHISCDDRSRSELVIPVVAGGEVRGVLDLDSPHVSGFSVAESERLQDLLKRLFDRGDVVY
jgi:L-methionine (R)-S-oxide reductase